MTTPHESDADAQVFDRAALLDSIHGDHELLQQFIDLFLQDFPDKIEALRTANPQTLGNAAHKVLGSARTMRLHRLAAAAWELQQMAEKTSSRPEDLADGVERVNQEYQRVVAILKR